MKLLLSAIVIVGSLAIEILRRRIAIKMRKNKLKQEALQDGKKAVDNSDAAGITDAFDRLR